MREIPSAAERARWLAEVADALDQAMALVERIGREPYQWPQRTELIHRIAAASQLTRALRLGSDRRINREIHP